MFLKAGAAQMEILPAMGTQIAGDISRRRPTEEIRDPIFVRALVVQSGEEKVCFLCFDVTSVGTRWADNIRKAAAEKFGFNFDAVTACATQTHSAPSLGDSFLQQLSPFISEDLRWLSGDDRAFHEMAFARALEAIAAAMMNLQEVEVGAASGIEARVAFNRRFVMRDGSARAHPVTEDPNILYAEGPIDPEAGVLCFRNRDGKVIAAILHYTCHPNHGYPHRYISADWPGAWCRGVRELLGEQCTPIVFNGCCGNIHQHNHLDIRAHYDEKIMGAKLTETIQSVLPSIEYRADGVLDRRSRRVPIAWRDFGDAFSRARELLEKNPLPVWTNPEKTDAAWDWFYAVSLLDLEKLVQSTPAFDYTIQTIRIGDTALVALPGEPFVEGGLKIKLESPADRTFIAHMANAYAGYIPTREALQRGGYETEPANWSKLAPEALDVIAQNTRELLNELFA